MTSRARRLGDLDRQAHPPRSVRDEIRSNLIRKLRAGDELFPGVVGYEESVVPQIINALLAKHDFILLGLRGQAKTRLCRMLISLMDEAVPVIADSSLREHPLAPLTLESRRLVEEAGDDLKIEWLEPADRYGEKLATPDVTMADLIGDIDPLKAAHRGLDLSDAQVINYGIIPRTNGGIFTINELPDLAPRIQVGLLNILEEQDIQIRGFPIRIPLDVLMVFTANPEDYTNRGSIITPLKDRIASQILTHYPRSLAEARSITDDEAWSDRGDSVSELGVSIPDFVADVVEHIAFSGRESEYVDQTSGVSARLSIAARELLVSQVERRMVSDAAAKNVPRLIDLAQLVPAITGKVELVYEGEQEGAITVARHLLGRALGAVFDAHFPDVINEGSSEEKEADRYKPILDWFAGGQRLELSDTMSDDEFSKALRSVPGLAELSEKFLPVPEEQAETAMELVLEGLHQHSLLAKEDLSTGASYSDMLGVMMEGFEN